MAGKKTPKTDEKQQVPEVRNDFDNLCRELNMDTSTAESAWDSYQEMKHKYTLEVTTFKKCFYKLLLKFEMIF